MANVVKHKVFWDMSSFIIYNEFIHIHGMKQNKRIHNVQYIETYKVKYAYLYITTYDSHL